MLVRPVVLNPSPSIVILMLGGVVGALLALGVMYAAPLAGLPQLDVLRALGGVFTGSPDAALGIGALAFLIGAGVVLPLVASGVWTVLPGREGSIAGTFIKAAAIAAAHWAGVGILLGLAGLADQAPVQAAPGLFGFGAGLQGVLLFALVSVLYGVAVAYVGFAEQGISALDAVGWTGFTHAATGPLDLGAHRSGEPTAPSGGERPWRGR
jgi:hypothetical protein